MKSVIHPDISCSTTPQSGFSFIFILFSKLNRPEHNFKVLSFPLMEHVAVYFKQVRLYNIRSVLDSLHLRKEND